MGYYLLGAFSLKESLYKMRSCWQRKDLVDCPEILKYSAERDGDITYYLNGMQCCVFVMKYGDFASKEDMLQDYEYEEGENTYQKCYENLLVSIEKKFQVAVEDVSWIMPLIVGDTVRFNSSHLEIKSPVGEESVDYVAVIDCAMIYQAINDIAAFFRGLSAKEDLDRFEQYQLSYYVQTINIIKNPAYYLVNSKEIKMYEELYQAWELKEQIAVVSELSEKTIELFSFLATYKKKNKIHIVEFFVPYISFVLSYNSIIEIAVFFVPQLAGSIEVIVKVLLLIGFIVTIVSLIKALRAMNKVNKRFEEKTCEK